MLHLPQTRDLSTAAELLDAYLTVLFAAKLQIYGLVQDCSSSSASAMVLRKSFAKPPISNTNTTRRLHWMINAMVVNAWIAQLCILYECHRWPAWSSYYIHQWLIFKEHRTINIPFVYSRYKSSEIIILVEWLLRLSKLPLILCADFILMRIVDIHITVLILHSVQFW